MNVLLVLTENAAVRESLRASLPENDLLLFEESIDEAGRRLASLQVDMIVLDDGPRLGTEAMDAVKAVAPGTPVLMLSSRGDIVTQAAMTRAGAAEVVVKPFSCDTLTQAIRAITEPDNGYAQAPVPHQQMAPMPQPGLNQHQMALRWLSRMAGYSDKPDRLTQSLVEAIADIFDAMRVAVLMEADGQVRVAASQGIAETICNSLQLRFTVGLMRWFDTHACLIDRHMAAEQADVAKELQVLGARMAVPLLRDGRVFGAIVLGEKASGLHYSPEERELLTLIARSASLAFEQAGAQAQTNQKKHFLDTLFDAVPAGIVVVSPQKRITLLNPEAETILRVRASELTGQSVQKLGSAFADVVLRAMQAPGDPLDREIHDAAIRARLHLRARYDEGQGVFVQFGVVAEETVATDEIAHSPFWEYLSQRIAQEVKNPMVAINTFAQLLPRKYDSEDFREAFSRVVQNEVARINHVVETLFSFAQDPQVQPKDGDVNQAVRTVLDSFEEQLRDNRIELEAEWDPEPLRAAIDPELFSQAVRHVLQNSIDAMPDGGRLKVRTHHDAREAAIDISDTGPGVAAQDSDLIFAPFYSTRERGMGLGLPLAQRIVRLHHGDLRLLNDSNGGRFAIRIPSAETQHANYTGDR